METDIFDLSGRVAVVTGASRGIGEEIAKILAQHGAHIIVSSRKIDDCTKVVDAIVARGGSAAAFACDIGNMDDITALFTYVKNHHGALDILVNNAAANPFFGHILDTDLNAYNRTVDVNIRGYFFMSVEGAKLMREKGRGVILNTASVNGIRPGPGQGIYSISKAAVINMTKAFARECAAFGIRVNALLPGLTKTKFAGALFTDDASYKGLVKMIPMGRHATPDEMAGTALYLVSDASSYTTGESILVDGGLTN